jgi:hypothetical protein
MISFHITLSLKEKQCLRRCLKEMINESFGGTGTDNTLKRLDHQLFETYIQMNEQDLRYIWVTIDVMISDSRLYRPPSYDQNVFEAFNNAILKAIKHSA